MASVTHGGSARRPGLFVGLLSIVSLLGLTLAVAPGRDVALAASSPVPAGCSVSGPTSGAYSVTLCFVSPTAGAGLNGTAVSVSTSISVTGTNPGIRRMAFTLNGAPLLTDFTNPYIWTLDTTRWKDGTYQLGVNAVMRDGFSTAAAFESVLFTNGIASAPVNSNAFSPTTGTAPAPGQPLLLAAVGDGAGGEAGETANVKLISSWNPNLFLYLGDVYENGRPMEFNNWYGAPGAAGLYGQLNAITDPVIGNHEYVSGDASGYFWYWNNIPHYYSFNAGGWHFVALDSTTQFAQTNPASAQYAWLQNDLAANTSPCILVYYHHPLFNVGAEGQSTQMAAVWSLLAQYHVSLVLNGHDHDYQRYAPLDGSGTPSPGGITEFVVGSGGHSHQGAVTTDARLVASDFKDFGALSLSLSSSGAAFKFVSSGTGATMDSGTVPCQGTPPPPPPADTTPPTAPGSPAAAARSSTEIDLSWTASTDNVGVAGYDVYRDGATAPLAVLGSSATSYADTSVVAGSTHSYTVDAFDASGNHSTPAGPVSATTPAGGGTVTVVLNPVADSYVNSANPGTNYGTSTALRVAGGTTVMRSYLRFDLSGVTGTIQSASLRLMANSSTSLGFSAFGVADNTWGETSLTYSNAPALSASAAGTSGPITSGQWASVNVATLVGAGMGGPMSVALTGSGTQESLASRESANPPQLVVTYTSGLAFAGMPAAIASTPSGLAPADLARRVAPAL